MARRGNVRGPTRPAAVVGRRRVPRWQAEHQRQRLAMAVGTAVLLFILALPVWGYITTFVLPPRKVVATVNSTAITMRDLLRNVRVLQRGAEATGRTLDLSQVPFDTLNSMVEDEVLRQMAPRLDIAVTTEEVDERIRSFFGDTSEGADPEAQKTELAERLRQYLNLIDFSDEQYRDQVRADLLREKAKEALGREVPPIQAQVHLYRLKVANEETLKRVQELAEAGTPFEELLDKYEADEANKRIGGEVGWFPKGLLGPDPDAIFDLKEGKLSPPGRQEDGSFVLFVVKERAEAREVAQDQLERLKLQALDEWLQAQRQEQEIDTSFSSAEYDWIVKQLGSSARRLPRSAGSP